MAEHSPGCLGGSCLHHRRPALDDLVIPSPRFRAPDECGSNWRFILPPSECDHSGFSRCFCHICCGSSLSICLLAGSDSTHNAPQWTDLRCSCRRIVYGLVCQCDRCTPCAARRPAAPLENDSRSCSCNRVLTAIQRDASNTEGPACRPPFQFPGAGFPCGTGRHAGCGAIDSYECQVLRLQSKIWK